MTSPKKKPHREEESERKQMHYRELVIEQNAIAKESAVDADIREKCERAASDFIARCWQHEIDHLNGLNLADREKNPCH